MTRFLAFLMLVCLFAAPAMAADATLEKGIALPEGIPDAVKSRLSPAGFRVLNESGAPYVEVWLNKTLPGEAKAADGDMGYPGLADGAFLGVWRFVGSGSDYRGQPVRAGLYLMRHALMPADGDHMGAFPYRDFVLLVPLSADPAPSAVMKWDEVVALSRKAAGTNHPAIFPMVPAEGAGEAALVKDRQGHLQLKVPLTTQSGGSMAIQVTVIGRGEQ